MVDSQGVYEGSTRRLIIRTHINIFNGAVFYPVYDADAINSLVRYNIMSVSHTIPVECTRY